MNDIRFQSEILVCWREKFSDVSFSSQFNKRCYNAVHRIKYIVASALMLFIYLLCERLKLICAVGGWRWKWRQCFRATASTRQTSQIWRSYPGQSLMWSSLAFFAETSETFLLKILTIDIALCINQLQRVFLIYSMSICRLRIAYRNTWPASRLSPCCDFLHSCSTK